MTRYDRRPVIGAGPRSACAVGWPAVAERIATAGARTVAVEAYPGVRAADTAELASRLRPDLHLDTAAALKGDTEIELMLRPHLTDDPVFGRLNGLELEDFFDPQALRALRDEARSAPGRVLVTGHGAALVLPDALLVYADLPRWEAQLRQRAGESGKADLRELYKRGYFVDWRVADRHKLQVWERAGAFLDTVCPDQPKLVSRADLDRALAGVARRPFRVVPYFDPAPWGGEWMRRVCGLDGDAPNYGWCFDCVPEENSLLLGFGDAEFEIPALDLVLREPRALLGDAVHDRFGAEFPIRFDFLDTIGGGNLSLQVHPSTAYVQEHFGLGYTQDESYYLLDAEPGAGVYLGLREGADRAAFADDLHRAAAGEAPFPADRYVNRWPARRHDHFLIPAGTVHCSGAGSMVLEISATPYIFTFKLWDWDRLGLDGRPRPLHLEHGLANIRWERDTEFVRRELVNRVTAVAEGPGWREERTGLHELEFIETRRHWFEAPVTHAGGTVQVLNLVQGEGAVVESPEGAFEPFPVSYAETFIVPAAAGDFSVRPAGAGLHATIKASVRV